MHNGELAKKSQVSRSPLTRKECPTKLRRKF